MLQFSGSEKKLVIVFLDSGPNLHKKGPLWTMPKMESNFLKYRRSRRRSSAFRNFLFYQNIISFDWFLNLFCFFLSKKCHFQLNFCLKKQLKCCPTLPYRHFKTGQLRIFQHSSIACLALCLWCMSEFLLICYSKWTRF